MNNITPMIVLTDDYPSIIRRLTESLSHSFRSAQQVDDNVADGSQHQVAFGRPHGPSDAPLGRRQRLRESVAGVSVHVETPEPVNRQAGYELKYAEGEEGRFVGGCKIFFRLTTVRLIDMFVYFL